MANKPKNEPDSSGMSSIEETTQVAEPVQPARTKEPKTNTVYSRADLMAAASAFGVSPDVMAGALRAAEIGEDGATKADAEKAVATFSERKV